MRRLSACTLLLVVPIVLTASCRPEPVPPVVTDEPVPVYTPSWAFEPWISKDISDGADTRAFLAGFQERDIPVGVVVLDSPWETDYNTFIPNEERYPAFEQMVGEFLDQGVRTVLWTTQMVNESSFDLEVGGDVYDSPASNYIEGQEKDYFVNDGEISFWWKGYGAAVDFFNPEATDWWHAQQDALLEMGVAGWKLDFGEQYIEQIPIQTLDGEKTLQEYSEAYYRDFFEYGARKHAGGTKEFLTMVRPYDESYGFEPRFYARPEHAPVAWPGDQYQSFEGMVDGLDHIFRSAQQGYAMLGTDIGGYLDTNFGEDVPFELDVFRRWTAWSTFMPFFQLHGRENLAPWTVPVDDPLLVDETVAQYRVWATLHHALVPFLFSNVREAQLHGGSALHVVGEGPEQWANDWRFFSGDAFLVAPLVTGDETRDVLLPQDEDGAGYIDWYDLGGPAIAGDVTVTFTSSATREVGLWVKEGAIVPMRLDRPRTNRIELTTGLDATFPGALTVLAFPGPQPTSFILHDDDDNTATLALDGNTLALDGVSGRVIIRLRGAGTAFVDGAEAPAAASLADLAEGASKSFADEAGRAVWVSVEDGGGSLVELR